MTAVTPDVDSPFADAIKQRLTELESVLVRDAQADTDYVTEAATHIIEAGGKRFRPLLVFLAAHVGHSETDYAPGSDANLRLLWAAEVMELTHVASLYHDDVMDEAQTRRGVPSPNQRWSNTVAILVGDFLFSRASSRVAMLGTDYVKLQADTFARLVQGQIAETRPVPGADPMQHYLQVISGKTSSLIAASCVFGGMVAGLNQEQLSALSCYGEEIGTVFQLSDDLIDVTCDNTGKTPGTDLREGVWTLPTLMLRQAAREQDGRLLSLLEQDLSADEGKLAEALQLLRANPIIAEARTEISRRAEVARGYLAVLPDGEAKEGLSALCDQVVSRSS